MVFLDRTQIAETNGSAPPARGKQLFAGILLAVLITTVAIRQVVPAEALAPSIVTLMFAVAAVAVGLARLCRRERYRTMWFDLGGTLTFIGIVISALIEPDQMVRLFTVEDQPE
jgi:hypothetical protein